MTATTLADALRWYEEQARLCRLIHSEGDAGRNALAADGGQRARAALAAADAAKPEPDMRHPKIQALIGSNARRNIELSLVEQLIDNPDCELSSMGMEYWNGMHDRLREALLKAADAAKPQGAAVPVAWHIAAPTPTGDAPALPADAGGEG